MRVSANCRKLLTLTLAVSRWEILRAVENLQCSTNIEQRRWHLVKFCAGGSHLFSRTTYQIVALKLDFTFTNKCIYYLRRSLLAIRRRKKWEISLTIVHASFTLYALSCRYFYLQCVFFFCFRSCTLFISTICWYWGFFLNPFFQTVGFALGLRQYTNITIIRGRMPTFLPRHMIVWESRVTARRLIPIPTTSERIYQLKVKTTFNYLLAIARTPHSRNIKLLAAGILRPDIYSSNVNFVSIWRAVFDGNFTLVIIFLDVKCLVSTKRKFESLLIIIFHLKEEAGIKTEKARNEKELIKV